MAAPALLARYNFTIRLEFSCAIVTASFSTAEFKEIFYPSSDGEPVAETYDHLYALLTTLAVLQQYLQGRQATVLANQFLYYSQGFPSLRVAPDVMVIFG